MKRIRSVSIVLSGFFLMVSCFSFADDLDEFKIKRTSVFEFTEKPSISRKGDRVTIRFTSKGFCDATVVIERKDGRIIRHLASGVLGPEVPAPFEKNSLEQNLVWDGKDDFGRYVDKREDIHVRVSLGLKPQFERTLFWSPKRRHSRYPQLACAAEEGVYV